MWWHGKLYRYVTLLGRKPEVQSLLLSSILEGEGDYLDLEEQKKNLLCFRVSVNQSRSSFGFESRGIGRNMFEIPRRIKLGFLVSKCKILSISSTIEVLQDIRRINSHPVLNTCEKYLVICGIQRFSSTTISSKIVHIFRRFSMRLPFIRSYYNHFWFDKIGCKV